MVSSSKQNSADSNLSDSSESETDGMTLKDFKMAACARAAANKDTKEGVTGQDNKEGDQQECPRNQVWDTSRRTGSFEWLNECNV